MWIAFALAYALATALSRYIAKPVAEELNAATTSWAMPLAGLPVTLIFVGLAATTPIFGRHELNITHLPLSFWVPMLTIMFVISPIQLYCLYETLKQRQVSWGASMTGLIPAIGGLIAWITLGETLGPVGWGSVATIIVGTILLNTGSCRKSTAKAAKPRTWHLPVIHAICTSLTAVLSKQALSASSPLAVILVGVPCAIIGQWILTTITIRPKFWRNVVGPACITIAVLLMMYAAILNLLPAWQALAIFGGPVLGNILRIFYRHPRDYHLIWGHRWRLLLSGTIDSLASTLGNLSLAVGPVGAVTAIFRTNLVFGVILGREKLPPRQFIAIFIIISGVAALSATKFG